MERISEFCLANKSRFVNRSLRPPRTSSSIWRWINRPRTRCCVWTNSICNSQSFVRSWVRKTPRTTKHRKMKKTVISLPRITLSTQCHYTSVDQLLPVIRYGSSMLPVTIFPNFCQPKRSTHNCTTRFKLPKMRGTSYSGIVHHLAGPNVYAHTQTILPKD